MQKEKIQKLVNEAVKTTISNQCKKEAPVLIDCFISFDNKEKQIEYLKKGLLNLKINNHDLSIFSGWAYVGYCIYANEQVLENDIFDNILTTITEKIMTELKTIGNNKFNIKDLSLVNGLVGTGKYLLKEWKRTMNPEIKINLLYILRQCLNELENILSSISVYHEEKTTIDFSVSHGISGLCIFICTMYKNGIMLDNTEQIISKIMLLFIEYIENAIRSNKDLSTIEIINGLVVYKTNKYPWSWCRGAIGIYYTVFLMIYTFELNKFKEKMLSQFYKSLYEIDIKNIFASSIPCHGLSGFLLTLDSIIELIPESKTNLSSIMDEIEKLICIDYYKNEKQFMEAIFKDENYVRIKHRISPLTSHASTILALQNYCNKNMVYKDMLLISQ